MVCSRLESCDVPKALMSIDPNHCDETRTRTYTLLTYLNNVTGIMKNQENNFSLKEYGTHPVTGPKGTDSQKFKTDS